MGNTNFHTQFWKNFVCEKNCILYLCLNFKFFLKITFSSAFLLVGLYTKKLRKKSCVSNFKKKWNFIEKYESKQQQHCIFSAVSANRLNSIEFFLQLYYI